MEELYSAGGKLHLIITLPDDKSPKKSGRIYVDTFASLHGIPVIKANHVNDPEVTKALKDFNIDWLFIIGWSQIASANVLNAVNQGCIGAHPTLLPQGRGRAAIPWAILKGLTKTGVTFFKLDEGVDTGSIVGVQEILVDNQETATSLYEKVNMAHTVLFNQVYFQILSSSLTFMEQDNSRATYWPGRTPKDGQILPQMKPEDVHTLVRATTRPYPGAFYVSGDKKIIVWNGVPSLIRQEKPEAFEITLEEGYYYAIDFEITLVNGET